MIRCAYVSTLIFIHFSISTLGASLRMQDKSFFERIIKNYDEFIDGVPIDYGYNESTSNSLISPSGLYSSPGCPKSEDGIPWVYYGSNSKKCFIIGERGPCGVNQILYLNTNSFFEGVCSCDCLQEMETGFRLDNEKVQFCKEERELRKYVFWPDYQKCFRVFDQGPCAKNDWIAKVKTDSTLSVHCEIRTCPDGQVPYILKQKDTCMFPDEAIVYIKTKIHKLLLSKGKVDVYME